MTPQLIMDNLKKFNLAKAKEGYAVSLEDGRRARIICFDSKAYCRGPLIALIEEARSQGSLSDIREQEQYYNIDGRNVNTDIYGTRLVMATIKVPAEHWVNIYREHGFSKTGFVSGKEIYHSENAAKMGKLEMHNHEYVGSYQVITHDGCSDFKEALVLQKDLK